MGAEDLPKWLPREIVLFLFLAIWGCIDLERKKVAFPYYLAYLAGTGIMPSLPAVWVRLKHVRGGN
jgi:hypothetical protein